MPVARYFVFVGSALAALLLIVSWYCSEPPAIFTDRPQIIATAAIRIKSERKWPEKIEFDTSQPTNRAAGWRGTAGSSTAGSAAG